MNVDSPSIETFAGAVAPPPALFAVEPKHRDAIFVLSALHRRSPKYYLVKRFFDVAFSLLVLALTWPLLLVIAIAIKLSSPGPVFFLQERVGLLGKKFKMIKFRTMRVNEQCDVSHTFGDDPRITWVGRLLRKTSLDEMPQFFNVLRGEMSIVGPRPELTYFVEKFSGEIPGYPDRHLLHCGITGWAQVNGLRGSHTSIPERVQYDLEYIRNWTFGRDLRIIVATIVCMVFGKNAI